MSHEHREKVLFLIPLLAGDALVAFHFAAKRTGQVTDNAAMLPLCILPMLFGTLCITFPEFLGMQHGAFGNSNVDPTPSPVVTGFGWFLTGLPLLAGLAAW